MGLISTMFVLPLVNATAYISVFIFPLQMHATSLYHQWITDSFSEDHLKLQFNANASWGLMYNMYPDRWLGLDVIDQEVVFCPFCFFYILKASDNFSGRFILPKTNGTNLALDVRDPFSSSLSLL